MWIHDDIPQCWSWLHFWAVSEQRLTNIKCGHDEKHNRQIFSTLSWMGQFSGLVCVHRLMGWLSAPFFNSHDQQDDMEEETS